jgi:hypothetical protein
LLFQFLQLLEKLVVFTVGDDLPAFDVIGAVVPADFTGELCVAFLGFGVRHAQMFNAKPQRSKAAKKEKSLRLRAFAPLR